MSIESKCPQCGVGVKVPESLIGKPSKCPQCGRQVVFEGEKIEIISPSPSAPVAPPQPAAPKSELEQLQDNLSSKSKLSRKRRTSSTGYRKPVKKKEAKPKEIVTGIMTLIVLVLVGWGVATGQCSGGEELMKEGQLRYAAEQYVKAQLVSPGTADFTIGNDGVTELGEGKYKVVGFVDSQNRLGATLRTDFVVILRETADGKKYICDDIAIQSR